MTMDLHHMHLFAAEIGVTVEWWCRGAIHHLGVRVADLRAVWQRLLAQG